VVRVGGWQWVGGLVGVRGRGGGGVRGVACNEHVLNRERVLVRWQY